MRKAPEHLSCNGSTISNQVDIEYQYNISANTPVEISLSIYLEHV